MNGAPIPTTILEEVRAISLALPDDPDWREVAELITDSYCVMAPKRLAGRVARPPSSP